MKTKTNLLLVTSLLIVLSSTKVNAYTEDVLKKHEENYTKSVIATLSEEDEVIELLNHNIEVNSEKYKVATIEKEKNKDVKKEVTKEKKGTLKTNNQNYIKEHFGEFYNYKDDEYEGDIPITHININKIDRGQYQELREKKIEFSKYSQNDLNNIEKEIIHDNETYYLISVDWQIDETEIIDNQNVPKSYKGTMIYQTVVTLNNPYEYEITVTYSGEVSKVEKEYTYTAIYQKEKVPIVVEPEKEEKDITIPTIIVSGIGIGLAVLIYLLSSKNVTIYNRSDTGYKKLGTFKLKMNEKNILDITQYNHKIDSNMYSIKMKKSVYEKLKGKVIFVKIANITKQITISNQFIEFLI